jgi:hypothetical protein
MHGVGLAPEVTPQKVERVQGSVNLARLEPPGSIEVKAFQVGEGESAYHVTEQGLKAGPLPMDLPPQHDKAEEARALIVRGKGVVVGGPVELSTYKIRSKSTGKDTEYYHIRRAGAPLPKVHDNQDIPAYLFAGGTVLSMIVLLLLLTQLPDLFHRTRIWLGSLFRYTTSIVNSKYLPPSGPVLMVTNADAPRELGDIHACCDRLVHLLPATSGSRETDLRLADYALRHDQLLLTSVDAPELATRLAALSQREPNLTILPVYHSKSHGSRKVKVILHDPLPVTTTPDAIRAALVETA